MKMYGNWRSAAAFRVRIASSRNTTPPVAKKNQFAVVSELAKTNRLAEVYSGCRTQR